MRSQNLAVLVGYAPRDLDRSLEHSVLRQGLGGYTCGHRFGAGRHGEGRFSEQAEAFCGDGGEQPCLVAEVVRGGGV